MAKAKQTDDLSPSALDQLAGAVASRIEIDSINDSEESERILRECCEEGRQPSFDELRWFWSKMRWDDKAVHKQLVRMGKVLKLQAVAGTSDDRARLAAEAEQAQAVLDAKEEALLQEIQAKQSALRMLQQSAAQSARRLEEVNQALTQLAEFPPEFIADQAKRMKRHGAATFRKRLLEVEALLKSRERMAGGPKSGYDHDTWIMHVRNYDLHAVQFRPADGSNRNNTYMVDPIRWEKIKADWEAERPALEAELAKLRSEWERVEAEVQHVHTFYHR